MLRTSRTLAVATAATALIAVTGNGAGAAGTDTAALTTAVTANGVLTHLQALQKIATQNGGTRASGTPGFGKSMDYVEGLLKKRGYLTSRQSFTFNAFDVLATPVFERVSPQPRVYGPEEFAVAEYSGSGNPSVPIVPVDLVEPTSVPSTSTSGCEASDYPATVAGKIALVQRGTCDFVVKAENAENAGAVGVIIYNEGTIGFPDRNDTLNPTLGDQADVGIPVVGTSYAIGDQLWDLAKAGPVVVHLQSSVQIRRNVPTQNLVAETPTGRDNQTVMAGAHLDSVPEGPGMNDDGSGSAALLEIALQLADKKIATRNTVRFAWWGAEEAGLVGSQRYVDSLSGPQVNDLEAYLNFDMIGSPNFGRFIYDGDGSAFGQRGPNGSEAIEAVFEQFFASRGQNTAPTAFDGRSDYDAFIGVGVPAGGLFTGAEDLKSPEEAALFGGTAGVAFDKCYHQACDDTRNINKTALDQMSDAAAHAILTFAQADASVKNNGNGTANPATGGDGYGHRDGR